MIQGMPNCRGAVLTTLALLITLAVAPPPPLFAAPRSAPARAADPIVAQVLQMLQGGVSEPVITTWLDKSGARPAAVGSADLVALKKAGASDALRAELVELNLAYQEKFGHVFLICATGLTGPQMLARLRDRLRHDDTTERAVVRQELLKITRLRMGLSR